MKIFYISVLIVINLTTNISRIFYNFSINLIHLSARQCSTPTTPLTTLLLHTVREIRLKSGKTLLMKSYYTYHRNRKTPDGTRYLCSMRGCACWLVMTEDLQVVRSSEQHAHDPPKFYVYNGIYFRIKK